MSTPRRIAVDRLRRIASSIALVADIIAEEQEASKSELDVNQLEFLRNRLDEFAVDLDAFIEGLDTLVNNIHAEEDACSAMVPVKSVPCTGFVILDNNGNVVVNGPGMWPPVDLINTDIAKTKARNAYVPPKPDGFCSICSGLSTLADLQTGRPA